MSNARADWEWDQRQEEQLLWEASVAVGACIEQGLRDKLIDSFPSFVREKLFGGYVLKEHYEHLEKKYDIAKMSSNITHAVIQEAW